MSLVYCYGVIGEGARLDSASISGFESGGLELVSFGDIIAVVSHVSEENFSQEAVDKKIKDISWLTENAQTHEDVVDSIMKQTTIIPMKFCTVFKSEENAESMLKERYADLKYNLNNLKGKVEIGVKVYFDSKDLKEKLKAKDSEIKALELSLKEKTPGAAYFEEQKIEILLKERMQEKVIGKGRTMFDKVKAISVDSRENELLNKKATGKDMLLNSVFLVGEDKLDDFKREIEGIKSSHVELEIQMWGPFPPYNFIR
jgi:hypothetical protein